jgi:hypothetical protein
MMLKSFNANTMNKFLTSFLCLVMIFSCGDVNDSGNRRVTPNLPFRDVTGTNLPSPDLNGLSMDAAIADFDGDGDPDIFIANEFRQNILLINNGSGAFANRSAVQLPANARDSEDVGVADFDADGDLDIVIVSEDDRVNELYFNNGSGIFTDVSNRIQAQGISNAVAVADFNNDGFPDILIGNNGQNFILLNRGNGIFDDESSTRLPRVEDVTQDVELGDVDGDGDLDIINGNEDRNRIWINNGSGFFEDETESRLPERGTLEETREAKLGDVDGDGDLDLFFANVEAFVANADRQNRLLLNDGNGVFTDVTQSQLPDDSDRSFTALMIDLDNDGDLDIVTGNTNGANFGGTTPYRVYQNEGQGNFTLNTDAFFPSSIGGRGFDIDAADFNGDGRLDLFFSSRGSADQMLFGQGN